MVHARRFVLSGRKEVLIVQVHVLFSSHQPHQLPPGAASVWFRLHFPTEMAPLRFFGLGDIRLSESERWEPSISVV